jgi:Ca2+-binding EF-hand superfamily protein
VALVLEQMLAEAAGVNEFREMLLDVASNTQAIRNPSRSKGTKSSSMLADTDRQGSADLDPTRFRGSVRALSDVAIDVADGLWGMGTIDEKSNTEKRLQEIFSEIDLDGSGTLDRGELAEMFRRSSGGKDDLSESALDTVMAELSAMRRSSAPLPGAADAEEIDFEHFCNCPSPPAGGVLSALRGFHSSL